LTGFTSCIKQRYPSFGISLGAPGEGFSFGFPGSFSGFDGSLGSLGRSTSGLSVWGFISGTSVSFFVAMYKGLQASGHISCHATAV
jgi:hypothetical protein